VKTVTHPVDVRVLAATNRDLEDAVAQENIRKICSIGHECLSRQSCRPPRSAREDIPLMVEYLIEHGVATKAGKTHPKGQSLGR